ncbi:MAG TPA: glycosyltransferase N-terminal domain-containing protein [Pseudobdellovibrionaceae bacterium]|nr:glycosyltransferase N-terminal domain-containing protein [Pseudobdellovibrionaceae bacterium]
MGTLAYVFYRWFLAPFVRLSLNLFSPVLGPKLRALVKSKNRREFVLSEPEEKIRERRPLWIHASSGEIEYARPVLRALREKHPDLPLLVTYSSPSAVRLIQSIPGLSAWGPVPWESPTDIRSFLRRFEPRALMVARTDLWPVLIDEVSKAGLPSLMFSATFAANSSRLRGFARRLTGFSLRRLSHLQLVSEDDRKSLGDLARGLSMEIAGDTRFDQVSHRLSHPKPLPVSLQPAMGPVLVAGSTWPEDERPLLSAVKEAPDWKVLLAPHETTSAHLEGLERSLQEHGISFQRFSRGGNWTEQVLLLDRVGLLAELYAWGDLAFVGGSFKKQVHSVMEPLAAGLRVLVGPHHLNNREALSFREVLCGGHPLVLPVANSQDLLKALRNPSLLGEKTEIKKLVQAREGATTQALLWLERRAFRN